MSSTNSTAPPTRPATLEPATSNTTSFLTIICVVWSLAFITALVRFYVRAILVRSFGKDDVFMVLAVVRGFVAWIIACQNGYGRRQVTIPWANFVIVLEAQWFQSVVEACFAFGFLKISIALSLLRLSRGTWYKWILWCLIAFTCFYTLFAFITFLTFCQPIEGVWNPAVRPRCYSMFLYRNFGLFNAACNIFTDITFATLPVPLIWSLQLQRRMRIYLIAILSGGYFAVALGIVRAIFIIGFVHERDGTFYPWAPFFESLQVDIGIIAACAPTLRPLFGQALHFPTTNYRGANYYRAGKALNRLPANGSAARAYQRRNTGSGEFVELVRCEKTWSTAHCGDTGFMATAVHAEHAPRREANTESPDNEIDTVLPLANDPEFKGIVKTTEFRIEK
ncbi:hypothetical protein N656DRAFT_718434 [Canariomyces notabilis]|uniref:Rhodopsin domain-containing protein n=1 Tax=Canariomyces notabilis TaxID=2074819 RepID=A0AAN6T8J8_9PEZI|nr:hypothetical protein N656DRAFT_718434 [Canariomyces arenarius]